MSGKQFEQSLQRLLRDLPQKIEGAVVAEGNRLIAEMKYRIFNEGKATSLRKLGAYKNQRWRFIRFTHGRQVAYKDFQHSGTMFVAFTIAQGLTGSEIVIGFTNDAYNQRYANEWLNVNRKKIAQKTKAERKILNQLARGFNPPRKFKSIAVYKVAGFLEQQVGERVFLPAKSEISTAVNQFTQHIGAIVNSYF